MENDYKEIIIENAKQKQTIYGYLKSMGHSENYLKNLRKVFGYIKLNNEPCFINVYVKNGDILKIHKNPNTKTQIASCLIPLDIVYEDDDVLCVNKPQNLSSMPTKSHYNYNLSGAIMAYMQNKDPNFVVRIVNRLDKEACGIVIVAKNSLASNFLNNAKNTKKTYYAICEGKIENELKIDTNIETTMNSLGYNHNKRITSLTNGKSALTSVVPVKIFDNFTLVKINIIHGRTHQIRVHLSSIGHALVGDSIYGNKSDLIDNTALICKEIEFVHPTTKQTISLKVDFPESFTKLTGNQV